ncbi:MAG: hypothetical protein KatS3mg115_2096 [Candidatus Poribacteria bacterium]|nr:MAG: hypothetical protein KatS3mg115_2096 [Candidatus Poribacteria bacterium]
MDLFNNLALSVREAVLGPPSERRVYRRPLLLPRMEVVWRPSHTWKVELCGGTSSKGLLSVQYPGVPQRDWEKRERVQYGGALLRWGAVGERLSGGFPPDGPSGDRGQKRLPPRPCSLPEPNGENARRRARRVLAAFPPDSPFGCCGGRTFRPEERTFLEPFQEVRHRDREDVFILLTRWHLSARWRGKAGVLLRSTEGLWTAGGLLLGKGTSPAVCGKLPPSPWGLGDFWGPVGAGQRGKPRGVGPLRRGFLSLDDAEPLRG